MGIANWPCEALLECNGGKVGRQEDGVTKIRSRTNDCRISAEGCPLFLRSNYSPPSESQQSERLNPSNENSECTIYLRQLEPKSFTGFARFE